jgi:hypothetical protein
MNYESIWTLTEKMQADWAQLVAKKKAAWTVLAALINPKFVC